MICSWRLQMIPHSPNRPTVTDRLLTANRVRGCVERVSERVRERVWGVRCTTCLFVQNSGFVSQPEHLLSTSSTQLQMVHSSRTYQYASYEEFQDNGMFSTEANCKQFHFDIPRAECPNTKYRDGYRLKCICGRTTAPRIASILHQSRI